MGFILIVLPSQNGTVERAAYDLPDLLTAEQIAKKLQISEGQVYELVRQGHLAKVSVGKREMRFTSEAVQDFIQRGGITEPQAIEVANGDKLS